MFTKLVLVGLTLAGGSVLVIGPRNVWDGARVIADLVSEKGSSVIPDDFRLKAIQKRYEDEKAGMADSQRVKAKLEVELEGQAGTVSKLAAKLSRDERSMASLRGQLPSGESGVRLVSTNGQIEVAKDLASRLAR